MEHNMARMSPQKLFDICLGFVARNVKYVESFEYIPDVIGKQIFTQTIQLGESECAYHLGVKTLKLFVSAYSSDLLTSLSLVNQRDVLDKYSEKFDVLLDCEGLVSLDLGNCSLTDDHPILRIIAQLNRLKILGLSHNLISGTGLRCLTTRVRMMKDGPVELMSLQLAGNLQIDDSCIRYLLPFKHIKFLDLSDNFITSNGLKSVCEGLHLTTMEDDREFVKITTSGWAAALVHTWLQETPELSTQAKQFYGHHPKRCHAKNQTQIQVRMRLISVKFKTNRNLKDSRMVQTDQPCLQNPVKHAENFEKQNYDVESEGRRKRRKLNVSVPHKEYHSFAGTSNKTSTKRKPKVTGVNIDENVPIPPNIKTRKDIRKNTLLSALDQAEPCQFQKFDRHLNDGYKSDGTTHKLVISAGYTVENAPSNQLKPLPIKKCRLKKLK